MTFDLGERSVLPGAESRVRPLPPAGPANPAPRMPRRFPVAPVLGALVVGMALGGLMARSSDPGGIGLESLISRPLPSQAQSAGLAESVEGFDNVLLVVAPNGVGAMQMLTWPPAGPLQPAALPVSWTAITFADGPFTDFAAFDATGEQVALAAPVAREGSVALLAGQPGGVVAVATGVTSYTWHRSQPRTLIYTVTESDGTWLEVMSGSPRQVERLAAVDAGDEIVAWAEWGYALAAGNRLRLIGPASRQEMTGRMLATGAREALIERDGDVVWVDPVTGSTRPTSITPGVAQAAATESGQLVAAAHADMLEVFFGDSVIYRSEWADVERLVWSLDERFLIFSDRVDVMVLDIERLTVTALGLSRGVALGSRTSELSSQ